ncbi:MAG: PHB depolymerase family esterase [Pirellulales bacterium]
MRNRVAIVSGLVFVAVASSATAANVNDFIDFSLRAADNSLVLPGRLYVPPSAPDPSPRPLILFLHGGGEGGTDNVAQVNVNIDGLLAETKSRGAFLYAPQTNMGWAGSTILTRTMTMIDRAIAEQQVDRNRLYVTGLSSGGGGVWNILSQFPDRFAAAVPIAPVTPFPNLPANLVGQPIWDFHARNDGSVSVTSSRTVISDILSAAGQPLPEYPSLTTFFPATFQFDNDLLDLHYTEFFKGSHSIWHAVYRQQDMYDWTFAHAMVPEPTSWALGLLGLILSHAAVRVRRAG